MCSDSVICQVTSIWSCRYLGVEKSHPPPLIIKLFSLHNITTTTKCNHYNRKHATLNIVVTVLPNHPLSGRWPAAPSARHTERRMQICWVCLGKYSSTWPHASPSRPDIGTVLRADGVSYSWQVKHELVARNETQEEHWAISNKTLH